MTESGSSSGENVSTDQRQQHRRDAVTGALRTISTLTPFQRRFLIELLSQTGPTNATQAYIDAGGKAKHPDRAAYQIRHNSKVVEAIEEYFHRQEMSAAETVALLSRQARFNASQYLRFERGENGRVTDAWVDLEALHADGWGSVVKGIKYTRDGRMMVEFYDAQSAQVHIGRYHSLFTDKTDLTSGGDKLETAVHVYLPDNGRDSEADDDRD